MLAVVVDSLTLTHYQCTDLGYWFITNFHYWLICKSLIVATYSPREWGQLMRRTAYAGVYTVMLLNSYFIRSGCQIFWSFAVTLGCLFVFVILYVGRIKTFVT